MSSRLSRFRTAAPLAAATLLAVLALASAGCNVLTGEGCGLPSVPTPKLPINIPAPKIEIPTPKIDIPAPKIDIPTPKFELPSSSGPSFSGGSRVSVPKVDVPTPKVEIPKVDIPSPKVDIPTPKVNIPKVDVPTPKVEIPKVDVPTPKVNMPKFELPASSGTIFSGVSTPKVPTASQVASGVSESWKQNVAQPATEAWDRGTASVSNFFGQMKAQYGDGPAKPMAEAFERAGVAGDKLAQVQSALGAIQKFSADNDALYKRLQECGGQAKVTSCVEGVIEAGKATLKPLADALIDHDCNTDAVNRWAEGWQSKNGPRIWDSKGLAAIAAAVFPGTQAYAVELILRELQNQVNGLEAVLDAALASAQAEGQKQGMRLLDVLPKLLEKAFRGENIPPPFEAPRIDVKLGFFRVNCNNKSKIQGVNAEAPAEGYVYWVFAWRMKGGVVSA